MTEVQRLREQGLSYEHIAGQVGVHESTIGDYLSTLRSRKALNTASANASRLTAPAPQTYSSSISWTSLLPPEAAWQSTPKKPGVYKAFLQCELPSELSWPEGLSAICPGDIVYVGKATDLRTRLKHHRASSARSSLRRTLASLFKYQGVWSGESSHPRLSPNDEAKLTRWMSDNLLVSFTELEAGESPTTLEKNLRCSLAAPFNKDSLSAEQSYVKSLGRRWRESAVLNM